MEFFSCSKHNYSSVSAPCPDCAMAQSRLLDDVRSLLRVIDAIPCTCDDAYECRDLTDPGCPRCNFVDEDTVEEVRAHVG